MPTSHKKNITKMKGKRAVDPIDRIIFEEGLRIRHLLLDRGLDLLVFVLSKNILALIMAQPTEGIVEVKLNLNSSDFPPVI